MKFDSRYIIAALLIGVLAFVAFNEGESFKNTRQMCISQTQNFTISAPTQGMNDICSKNKVGSQYETSTYVGILVFVVIGYLFLVGAGRRMLTMREAIGKANEWILELTKDSVIDNCKLMPQMHRVQEQGEPVRYDIGYKKTSKLGIYVVGIDCWTGDIKLTKDVDSWNIGDSKDITIMAVPKEVEKIEIVGHDAKDLIDARGDKRANV